MLSGSTFPEMRLLSVNSSLGAVEKKSKDFFSFSEIKIKKKDNDLTLFIDR
jgi:hypothetical protein